MQTKGKHGAHTAHTTIHTPRTTLAESHTAYSGVQTLLISDVANLL